MATAGPEDTGDGTANEHSASESKSLVHSDSTSTKTVPMLDPELEEAYIAAAETTVQCWEWSAATKAGNHGKLVEVATY